MAKRNNGKSFEKLVAIIQQAYKDVPHTKIFINHLVEDRWGRKREFDVFIVTKVNGIDFRIAIECKNFDKPVPVEKVEAFNSKCSTISNINKKIMFSSRGFQSAAIENAKAFDIELATLEDIKKATVTLNGNNIYHGFARIGYVINDYDVIVKNEIFGEISLSKNLIDNTSYLKHVNDEPMQPISFILRELRKTVRPEMFKPIQDEATKHGVLAFERDWVINDSFFLTALEKYPFDLIYAGKKLPVVKIRIDATLYSEFVSDESTNVDIKVHNDSTNSKKGELFSVNFKGEEQSEFYYKFINDSKEKIVSINDNEVKELSTKFTVNTKTGEFDPPHTDHSKK